MFELIGVFKQFTLKISSTFKIMRINLTYLKGSFSIIDNISIKQVVKIC